VKAPANPPSPSISGPLGGLPAYPPWPGVGGFPRFKIREVGGFTGNPLPQW